LAKIGKKTNKYWDLKESNHHTIDYSPKEYHKIDASAVTDDPNNSYFPYGKWNDLKRKEAEIQDYFVKEKEFADKNHLKELYNNAKNYFAIKFFLMKNEEKIKDIKMYIAKNKTNDLNNPANTNPAIISQITGEDLLNIFESKINRIDSTIYDPLVKKPYQ
jgi:hypothetical protein